ncbi:MAG: glucoamylase family protein [Oscillospiraceae bacterium]|nr:glucoamylase family protein [Oscillospiraceae bacterium]
MDTNELKQLLINEKNAYISSGSLHDKRIDGRELRLSLDLIRGASVSAAKKRASGIIPNAIEAECSEKFYLFYGSSWDMLQRTDIRPTKKAAAFAESAVRASGGIFEEELYPVFFETLCSSGFFSCADVRSVKNSFVRAFVIYSAEAMEEDDEKKFSLCADSLRACGEYDFTKLTSAFDPCERILRSDADGVFAASDYETRSHILRSITEEALKAGENEEDWLIKLYKDGISPLETAFKPRNGFGYFVILYILSAAVFVTELLLLLAGGLYFSGTVVSLLTIPLCVISAKTVADHIYSRLIPARPIPRLNASHICAHIDEMRVVTVTTAVCGSKKDAEELIKRAEMNYLSSEEAGEKTGCSFFGLLIDFPESNNAYSEKDDETLALLKEGISRLNRQFGEAFCLFWRKRIFDETDKVWRGYERKRGALGELIRYLSGRDDTTIESLGEKRLENIKYLITLDADTEMMFMSVYSLVGAMAHPLNRPKISDAGGIKYVNGGYAIMQPKISPALFSSAKTPFSLLQCGAGGADIYHTASFDLYQSLFDRGVFCGKGIIDIGAAAEVLDGLFKPGTVLSHDIPEGAFLSAAKLTDVSFFDSVPSDTVSYLKRSHRWTRGDIQNLCFTGRKLRNKDGKTVINPISKVYRHVMRMNVVNSLAPAFSAFILIISLILPPREAAICALFALLPYLLPVIDAFVSQLAGSGAEPFFRRFFVSAISGAYRALLNMLYRISALFASGVNSVDAAFRSIWRMGVSHRRLLEWHTFASSEKRRGAATYLKNYVSSIAFGAVIALVSPLFTVKLCGILCAAFPTVAYIASLPYIKKKTVSSGDTAIAEYAADMWKFFDENVGPQTGHLPPDNVSLSPVRAVAMRTSPTNIGMYLVSCAAAADFGIISWDDAASRALKALKTVLKLKKYKGHLYNWYSLETFEPIGGGYVSSVDSGNLIACLISLASALKDNSHSAESKEAVQIAYEMRANADFGVFRDSRRALVSLGIDSRTDKCDKILYDKFMSESRLAVYIAVADRDIQKRYWFAMERTLISSGMYLGAAAWSGTAFEFFMPRLFLPTYENSFTDEALKFAYNEQSLYRVTPPYASSAFSQGVFGISESGYFAFDSEFNYQYRAFGVPALSISKAPGSMSPVISPYSSFLMLPEAKSSVLYNLRRLKKLGMYGKYGFYEAYDCDRDRTGGAAIISCYMAHHIGMSMTAAANAVFGDVFVKRFMADDMMRSASLLLAERVPTDAPVYRLSRRYHTHIPSPVLTARRAASGVGGYEPADPALPRLWIFGGSGTILYAPDNGNVRAYLRSRSLGTVAVCRPAHGQYTLSGAIILYTGSGSNFISSSTQPGSNDEVKCREDIAGISIKKNLNNTGADAVFSFSAMSSAQAFILTASGSGKGGKAEICAMSFDAALCQDKEFYSHPAFASLFISIESPRRGVYTAVKRRKSDRSVESACTFGAIAINGIAIIDDELFCGDEIIRASGISALLPTTVRAADKTFPFYPVRPHIMIKCHAPEVKFVLACGNTASDSLYNYDRAYAYLEKDKIVCETEHRRPCRVISGSRGTEMREMLEATTYALTHFRVITGKSDSVGTLMEKRMLWSFGISGDLPIELISVPTTESTGLSLNEEAAVISAIRIKKECALIGHIYDLVILIREKITYSSPVSSAVRGIISDEKCDHLMNVKGGIFVITSESGDTEKLLQSAAIYSAGKKTALRPAVLNLRKKGSDDGGSFFITEYGNTDGFSCDKFIFDKKAENSGAWAHVIAVPGFGTVMTATSLGYTWRSNSQQQCLTMRSGGLWGDDEISEKLYLCFDGDAYDLIKLSSRVVYSCGLAEYFGQADDISYKVSVTVSQKCMFKMIRVALKSNKQNSVKLIYSFNPSLGSSPEGVVTFIDKASYAVYERTLSTSINHGGLFLKAPDNSEYFGSGAIAGCGAGVSTQLKIKEDASAAAVFYLGSCEAETSGLSERHIKYLDSITGASVFGHVLAETRNFLLGFLPQNTPVDSVGTMAGSEANAYLCFRSFWVSYQAVVCRFFARSGLIQSSGAYGFRDQLQDCLLFIEKRPEYAARMILRAASHQFIKGDVMHWFHIMHTSEGNPVSAGIRTMCSDDYMWLIYCACEYIEKTGDSSLLETKAPFLSAPPLTNVETERYIVCTERNSSASVLDHLTSAAELFIERGVGTHMLPLMFGGDWNDGMDMVGRNGGESVWLAFFGALCLQRLSKVLVLDDPAKAKKYHLYAMELLDSADKAYNGKWYGRAYHGNGEAVGFDLSLSSECSIDLIPQVFAAFCYAEIPEYRNKESLRRAESALISAYDCLSGPGMCSLKLFTLPFSETTDKNPGYICAYPPGVRENGGQYTHASVWLALAFLRLSEYVNPSLKFGEMSERILYSLSPTRSMFCCPGYRMEPYVLCGDVYSGPFREGRGGWSWYTGAAGWMARTFGLSDEIRKKGKTPSNKPFKF